MYLCVFLFIIRRMMQRMWASILYFQNLITSLNVLKVKNLQSTDVETRN
jgi:hypothetical protein